MSRRNYLRRSGVIIDACKTHGIWLDCFELERIIAWLRSNELEEWKRVGLADKQEAKFKPVKLPTSPEEEPMSMVDVLRGLFSF